MGLAESLNNTLSVQKLCPLGRTIEKLNEEDRDALIAALASNMSYRTIEMALRKEGHKTGTNTILEHRRKNCACYWGNK